MRIDIITAVPGLLKSPLNESIVKRARKQKLVGIYVHDLRKYALGKYRQVDDKPFGGGAGMVLKPEPLFACIEKLLTKRNYGEIIYLTPQGKKYSQSIANELSLSKNLLVICGHYKGIDQRVIDRFVTLELSIGDYVLTGGELAAMVVVDSIVRLIPGAIGDGESALTDSFQTESGFDSPVYTRPSEYRNLRVPDILLSGDHSEILKWRFAKGLKKYRKVKKKK